MTSAGGTLYPYVRLHWLVPAFWVKIPDPETPTASIPPDDNWGEAPLKRVPRR